MSKFTEFYSKVCVAGSVRFVTGEAFREENQEIGLSEGERFSRSLATILARDREVVAVNLKLLPDKCRVYISKNGKWLERDVEYINEIQRLMKNLSKDAPMKFAVAIRRNDMHALLFQILEYCSVKLGSRLNKLKKDIEDNKNESFIKSFLEFLKSKTKVDNLDGINEYQMSATCCEFYNYNKNNKDYPPRFLGHVRKVGSYSASLMDIVNCARKQKYKTSFSCIDLHRLDPVHAEQRISSWRDIITQFIPNLKNFENFKKNCLNDHETRKRLYNIYHGHLDRETNNRVYLHAELNILTNTDILSKEHNEFIAVSKKCCYLCESYIKFLRSKGYKITVSGAHKKLYHGWKLPDTYNEEFVENILWDLDQIIESGIKRHTKVIAKSDSDGESPDSDNLESNFDALDDAAEGVLRIKANSNL